MVGTIVQFGSLNTTAIVVPGLYVQVKTPAPAALNGSPTNVIGVVGTATWGPVNVPSIVSNPNDFQSSFGPIQNRKYDMGTAVSIMSQQGAAAFRCVRVTDGTDAAAAFTLLSASLTGAAVFWTNLAIAINTAAGYVRGPSKLVTFNGTTGIFAANYTGTYGNRITVSISPGSAVGTARAVIGTTGASPEVFDNVPYATGAAPATTATPYALTGGADGATPGIGHVTAATLMGSDASTPRTGLYALRRQGCSVGLLVDCDDSTQWANATAYGLSEGTYMVLTTPSGDTISNATTVKAAAGLDTYGCKLMFGDWVWWSDTVNSVLRLASPATFVAGLLGNLSPEQSTLNKPLQGVVGTQMQGVVGTTQVNTYSQLQLQTLIQAGLDVIGNPSPGGNYFAVQGGVNASSNGAINGDNYTRMVNYLASTIAAGMGIYVGQGITDPLFNNVRSELLATFFNCLQQGQLTQFNGGGLPYSVQCDNPAKAGTNNPASRTQLGYVQADCIVQLIAINTKFLVNLTAGQTAQPQVSVIASPV